MTSSDPEPTGPDTSDQQAASLTALQASTPSQTPGRVRRLGRRLLRILLLLLAATAIGAGIYFGWPVVYDRYIRPVETNTADLTSLQQQVDQAAARISQLENESVALRADFETIANTQTGTVEQIDQIAGAIDRHTQRLDDLDALAATLTASDDRLESALGREVALLRSMELLSRARLFLYQANYGLASQDLTSARAILTEIETSADDDGLISETVFRIDRSLGALPDRPVPAADDLDIAWQALLGELPPPTTASTTTEPTSPTTSTPSTTP